MKAVCAAGPAHKGRIVIDGKNFLKIENGSVTYRGIGR